MTEKYPYIGISLGDPGGVGPEVVFKTLSQLFSSEKEQAFTPILFGAKQVLDHPLIKKNIKDLKIKISPPPENPSPNTVYFVDCDQAKAGFTIGQISKENGQIAYDSVIEAIAYAKEKKIQALVTAPINKESFLKAGISYTGHTTLLADQTQSKDVSMAFYTPTLKTVLATIHNAFKDVPSLLTEANLEKAVKNSVEFARTLQLKDPKIALAGLNPHAGENGLFGSEEQDILSPFVEKMQAQGLPLSGPYPPDTLYHRAHHGDFDIVISLYHDQGLIPVKLLAFDSAVNVSLGLPFLRTSPDHGTAFDIAYQNKASINSFKEALSFAIKHHNIHAT